MSVLNDPSGYPLFERGPIRPPSESASLPIRLVRNCPWNRCVFCRSYAGTSFSLRSAQEVKKDIVLIRETVDRIRDLSASLGHAGCVTRGVMKHLFDSGAASDGFLRVAVWLYRQTGNVFLQDADPLVWKTPDLMDVLQFLRRQLPFIGRVTCYARSGTLARKPLEELADLRRAGLTRVHMGLESGCDEVLSFVRKGVDADRHRKAGLSIRKAGIELSVYVMPGLGGRLLSEQHARMSADVVNDIKPDLIRLRTLHVLPGTALDAMARRGDFERPSDDGIVREIRLFIDLLNLQQTRLVSDHVLNLLEELEGTLPEDKARLLETIDGYLSWDEARQRLFQYGKYLGAVRYLSDFQDDAVCLRLAGLLERLERQGGSVQQVIASMKERLI
ncbi:MAG TPA: radical SAM protein [Smithellaceae bacterium]|nr:radical SAM protein [Smithellaceae bacterium]